MKTRIIFLLGLAFFCCSSGLHAQLFKEAVPIYEAAKSVLESEYATRQFPPKIARLMITDNLPDTITFVDVRLYNFSTVMRSRKGKVDAKTVPIILKIINSDADISIEEKALLDAIKNNKNITVYSTEKSKADRPVNLTFNTGADAKKMITDFYEKGASISSLGHMHLTFLDSNNMNNWLDYYYGNAQQKELALDFMQFKILELFIQGEGVFEKYNKLFENFVESIQVKFSLRDKNIHPAASRNLILNIMKEFDEAGYISLPDYVYMNAMKK